METNKDTRPYILSKILDLILVGTKEDIEIRRTFNSVWDHCKTTLPRANIVFVGSQGDGFSRLLTSDTDMMSINRNVIVMYPDMYQDFIASHIDDAVLFIREAGCNPGYVHLELSTFRQDVLVSEHFMDAVVPVLNSKFLSSERYREFNVDYFVDCCGYKVSSAGPSNKLEKCCPYDFVQGFSCICWPKDADEWPCRPRVFGWPNEALIKQIISEGCHLVPAGDKCSDDTFLQWRFSFAVAETQLIHSLNHIQFKVYGLLKYLLKQIKYRIRQDIGDDDILCSYFIKTLILYSVENSPQSLWQEKNIFVCFSFCFNMLLDWVHSGYCPNYFIPANNMFRRKVQGASKLKLLNILCELQQMNWGILSIGNAYKPSILDLLQAPWIEMFLFILQTTSFMEMRKDIHITSLCSVFHPKIHCLHNLLKMLLKPKYDDHETICYLFIVKEIARIAFEQYEESKDRHGNKVRYSSMRKSKRLLTLSFGSDLLYFATFFYKTGNYKKARELCVKHIESVTEDIIEYMCVYFGRGTSTFNRLKQTHTGVLYFHKSASDFCLSELLPELHSSGLPYLIINPTEYSFLLMFLSCFSLGDKENCRESLFRMDLDRFSEESWKLHTFAGICYQKLGEYHHAVQAYQDSHRITPKDEMNPALERIKALICSQRL